MVKIILNRLSYFEKDDYWGHIFYCDEFDILPTIDILYGGNTNYAVFGDVFMRNYYVVFD